jgi:hypothetical protein
VHVEFMLHFMLLDGHVVLVIVKEKMSNYCSTNLGSLMIMWSMKKIQLFMGEKGCDDPQV